MELQQVSYKTGGYSIADKDYQLKKGEQFIGLIDADKIRWWKVLQQASHFDVPIYLGDNKVVRYMVDFGNNWSYSMCLEYSCLFELVQLTTNDNKKVMNNILARIQVLVEEGHQLGYETGYDAAQEQYNQ